VDSGASALPSLLAALDTAGIRASTATVARPSLDDVYLRHTGHAYADANQKETIR
jgi:ABC-2 type transport system ATP-binding protein